MVLEFLDMFPYEIPMLPLERKIVFTSKIVPGAEPVLQSTLLNGYDKVG